MKRPFLHVGLALAALLTGPAAHAQPAETPPPAGPREPSPAGPPLPDGDEPVPPVVPLDDTEAEARRFPNVPLQTAPQPDDTATTEPMPVNPGLDGDAPSETIPIPAIEAMPRQTPPGKRE